MGIEENKALDTGESQDFSLPIPATAKRLKATLVWTDPPGEGLQSDLDLIVKIGSVERHGNVAATSLDFDRTNNVEQIVWSDLPQGTARITVTAHSIAIAEQSFALVVRLS